MRAAQVLLDAVRAAAAVDPHAVPDEPLLADIELLIEAQRRIGALLARNLQAAPSLLHDPRNDEPRLEPLVHHM